MTKKQMKVFATILNEKKKDILTMLMRDSEEYSELNDDEIGDLIDIANKNYEKKLMHDMSQNERNILELIDEALNRIEDGTYGKCAKCGIIIDEKRLEVIPYAVTCVDCKKNQEKQSIFDSITGGSAEDDEE